MTTVINIKKSRDYDLYIGRKNSHYNLQQSKWANPFIIGKDGDRKEVVLKHRLWINSQPELLRSLHEIKDKKLGCWCNWPDEECHGGNLVELADSKYIKNWFSNMLPFDTPLVYQDIVFKTVENFYQAMKLPKNRIDLRKEIAAKSPWEAKRDIRNKDKYLWDEKATSPIWASTRKLKVMRYALKWKFKKGTEWARKLKITKDLGLELVEWNNWNDTFFGKKLDTEEGHNYLGKILTQIRDKL